MNLEKASAVAEIVSAFAIVVTLLYLAIQTSQNTEAIRAATRQAMVESEVQLLLSRAENPARITALCKEKLTIEEAFAIQSDLFAVIRMREHDWIQFKNGNLDEQTWVTYRGGLIVNLSPRRMREIWNRYGSFAFDPDFVAEINDYLPAAADVPNENLVGICEPAFR